MDGCDPFTPDPPMLKSRKSFSRMKDFVNMSKILQEKGIEKKRVVILKILAN